MVSILDHLHERDHIRTPMGKAKAAVGKVLGYHTVYHGTDRNSVNPILQKGLTPNMPSKSGDPTGMLKDNVYVSKNKDFAKSFSHSEASKKHIQESLKDADINSRSGKDMLEAMSKFNTDGAVMKGRIPDSMMRRAKPDHFLPSDLAGKFHGAMLQETVPGHHFRKSSLLSYVKPSSLAEYWKDNPRRAKEGLHELAQVFLRKGKP
jgi:hypothetical protein